MVTTMLKVLLAFLMMASPTSVAWPLEEPLRRYQSGRRCMGTSFEIVLYASTESTAKLGFQNAFDRVEQLDRALSGFDPQSELSRVNRSAASRRPIEISSDLSGLLQRSLWINQRSGGAFDVTVGPLVRLWRRARRHNELPPPDRLARALDSVGHRFLKLDPEHDTLELLRDDVQLDLGAIGKGYAADQALKTLRALGIPQALVNAGGDIALGDPPPGRSGWQVGLAPAERGGPPTRLLSLHSSGVATSGDTWKFVEIGGTRYSHIIDPRNGMGLTDRSEVTVIASDCTLADGLASAVSVLGPQNGMCLIDAIPNAEAWIVQKLSRTPQGHESRGFSAYVVPK